MQKRFEIVFQAIKRLDDENCIKMMEWADYKILSSLFSEKILAEIGNFGFFTRLGRLLIFSIF